MFRLQTGDPTVDHISTGSCFLVCGVNLSLYHAVLRLELLFDRSVLTIALLSELVAAQDGKEITLLYPRSFADGEAHYLSVCGGSEPRQPTPHVHIAGNPVYRRVLDDCNERHERRRQGKRETSENPDTTPVSGQRLADLGSERGFYCHPTEQCWLSLVHGQVRSAPYRFQSVGVSSRPTLAREKTGAMADAIAPARFELFPQLKPITNRGVLYRCALS
jgi:hypothetical protein